MRHTPKDRESTVTGAMTMLGIAWIKYLDEAVKDIDEQHEQGQAELSDVLTA